MVKHPCLPGPGGNQVEAERLDSAAKDPMASAASSCTEQDWTHSSCPGMATAMPPCASALEGCQVGFKPQCLRAAGVSMLNPQALLCLSVTPRCPSKSQHSLSPVTAHGTLQRQLEPPALDYILLKFRNSVLRPLPEAHDEGPADASPTPPRWPGPAVLKAL